MSNSFASRHRELFGLFTSLALIACNGIFGTVAMAEPSASLAADSSATVQNGASPAGHFGHYFSTHYSDTPQTAAMLCEKPGVTGVVWRQAWSQVETAPGKYNFQSFDTVLRTIAASRKPNCQLFVFVEFKSFNNSPVKNPCPTNLRAQHSGLNAFGNGAATCFMWDPVVRDAYISMIKAAAQHFRSNPHVEGYIIQESALGFSGKYSQDKGSGGTYTPMAWRDSLISIISECSSAFSNKRCMAFINFLRGNQSYIADISAAIAAVPNNRACISGPDLLPNEPALYKGNDAPYPVIARHPGCRSISAQNASYHVPGCSVDCIFDFAVGGTLGVFSDSFPHKGGLCVNSYIFWNDKLKKSPQGQGWEDALHVMASHPYGRSWFSQCAGNDGPP